MKRPKIAIVRGKFLNKFEMQTYEHLAGDFDIQAFGSLTSFHTDFKFPVQKLISPVDLPGFPLKMPILNRIFTDAHCLFDLEESIKGYDIAHSAETYFHYTQQCLNAKRRGWVKKVVVTVYENIPHANEGIRGRKNFKKVAYRDVDLFLAITKSAQDALMQEGVDKKKIKVIGAGVDIKRFSPRGRKKTKEQIDILFIGRLEEEKGIRSVIEAFSEIENDNIHLTIIGDGSLRGEIEAYVKKKDIGKRVKVKKVPYKDIHKHYQSADIFVAPSIDTSRWREQFGYSLVEAMASGLSIVTTDAGAIPEVVGNAGVVVPQDNSKHLCKALNELAVNEKKRKRLGAKARAHAVKYYDAKKIAAKIGNIYKGIL